MHSARVVASINSGPSVLAELTIEREQIEVRSMTATKPDMRWTYIDQRGHFHAYANDGELPTLITRIEQVPCPGGCDDPGCEGYTITHYHCTICDEEIEPKRLPDTDAKFIPGPTSWTVEVEQDVTEERVSIRLSTGAANDPVEVFGIAARGAMRAEGGSSGVRVWTTLHGMSPLGQRKSTAPAQHDRL